MSSLIVVLTNKASNSVQITPVIENLTQKVSNVRFGSALGTGFNICELEVIMPYTKSREWYERYLFYGINIYEADESVWEGRIEAIKINDSGISLSCVGYWASLADQRLYSFWSDNRMSAWLTPAEGVGGIANEIGLSSLVNRKGWILADRALWGFGFRNGQTYAIGDRMAIYYRLPRTDHLSDSSIFQPNTIHSIQFQWDKSSPAPSKFTSRVWTALHAKDTSWTEKDATNPAGTPGIKTVNIGSDTDIIQAVAFGIQVTSTETGYPDDDGHHRMLFTNVIIWTERDAARGQVNENTSKKMIIDLLKGNSDINLEAKGLQISSDLLDVSPGDSEIIPAVFEDEALQDIINKTVGFGTGVEVNLIDNPSVELNIAGWTDQDLVAAARVTNETVGEKGLYVAKTNIANLANQGFIIKRQDGSRIPVIPERYYTFSAYVSQSSFSSKSFDVRIRWYTSSDVFISVDTVSVIISSTFLSGPKFILKRQARIINKRAPLTAAKVQIEIQTASAIGAFSLWADGAMLQESQRLEPYIDGASLEGLWSGDAHKSISFRLQPTNYGVWGRRRLQIKQRDKENIKWVIPRQSMEDNGLTLERTVEDFWVRIWGKFNESFTGLDSFTDVFEDKLNQELLFDQRGKSYDFGSALTEFAEAASRVALSDSSNPHQKASIEIKGWIANIFGAREPLWRVRAGDLIIIPDLVSFGMYGYRGTNKNDPYDRLDSSKIFVIRETEYDAGADVLTITPDLPPQTLESVLAYAAITSSFIPSPTAAQSSTSRAGRK